MATREERRKKSIADVKRRATSRRPAGSPNLLGIPKGQGASFLKDLGKNIVARGNAPITQIFKPDPVASQQQKELQAERDIAATGANAPSPLGIREERLQQQASVGVAGIESNEALESPPSILGGRPGAVDATGSVVSGGRKIDVESFGGRQAIRPDEATRLARVNMGVGQESQATTPDEQLKFLTAKLGRTRGTSARRAIETRISQIEAGQGRTEAGAARASQERNVATQAGAQVQAAMAAAVGGDTKQMRELQTKFAIADLTTKRRMIGDITDSAFDEFGKFDSESAKKAIDFISQQGGGQQGQVASETEAGQQGDLDNNGIPDTDTKANDRQNFVNMYKRIQKERPNDPWLQEQAAHFELAKKEQANWLKGKTA